MKPLMITHSHVNSSGIYKLLYGTKTLVLKMSEQEK